MGPEARIRYRESSLYQVKTQLLIKALQICFLTTVVSAGLNPEHISFPFSFFFITQISFLLQEIFFSGSEHQLTL